MSTELVVLTKHKNKIDFEEWLNYHLALGFDYISIYDNESYFNIPELINGNPRVIYYKISDEEIQKVSQQGLYTIHHNNSPVDWQLYIDDDEFLWFDTRFFLNVNAFVNTFPEYVHQWGIFWQKMSTKDPLESRTDTFINTFKYAQTGIHPQCIKTFVRKGVIGDFLHPHKLNGPNVNCYSAMGKITDLDGTKLCDTTNHFCKIYHFQCRTISEYNEKLKSLRVDRVGETYAQTGYDSYETVHNGYNLYDPTLLDMKKKLGI